MKIGEFFVELGVKADTVTVKRFVQAIGDLPLEAAAGIAALAEIDLQLVHMAGHALDTAIGLQQFHSQTGLGVEQLERWQSAAKHAGTSAEAVQSSVMGLSKVIADISLGRGAGYMLPFNFLHVDWRGKDPFKILEALRKSIKGMDPKTVAALLPQIGVSAEMAPALQMPEKQFSEYEKAAKVMSAGQVSSFTRLHGDLGNLAETVLGEFNPLLQALLPTIEKASADLVQLAIHAGPALKQLAIVLNTFGMAILRWLVTPLTLAVETLDGLTAAVKTVRRFGMFGAKVIGTLGMDLAEEVIKPHLTGTADVLTSLLKDNYGFGGGRGGFSEKATPDFNLIQNIHTMASAEEVARLSAEHLSRAYTRTSNHLGKVGI